MVNESGQLYTIEGVAAALLLLITAYFVVNSTSVYTPGDTHLSDMQLEVTGSDALAMMDTADNITITKSPLRQVVEQDNAELFNVLFPDIINARIGETRDDIQYVANITYINPIDNTVTSTHLANSSRPFTGTEHAVRVSRWVLIENPPFPEFSAGNNKGMHAALVEVLLWRD